MRPSIITIRRVLLGIRTNCSSKCWPTRSLDGNEALGLFAFRLNLLIQDPCWCRTSFQNRLPSSSRLSYPQQPDCSHPGERKNFFAEIVHHHNFLRQIHLIRGARCSRRPQDQLGCHSWSVESSCGAFVWSILDLLI